MESRIYVKNIRDILEDEMATGIHAIAFIFIIGLGSLVGSFLNVVGYRLPHKQSFVRPRLHCTGCLRPLGLVELIPVISWVALRGKCRTCASPISLRYPFVEISTACLFGAAMQMSAPWSIRIGWTIFWIILMATVATDLFAMKVPNVISLPGAVVMYVLAVATSMQTWTSALVGLIVCFSLMLVIHLLSGGRMGLGDVKLYLAIGAALGALHGVESLVLASFYGSIIGLSLRLMGRVRRGQYIPFVPFIALGVVTVAFWGGDINHWYFHDVLGIR